MLDFLGYCVKAQLNCLISGGTGAGKTTLLNVMSSFIGEHERIATIEDAAELQLHQEHVVRLRDAAAQRRGQGRGQAATARASTRSACAPTASWSARCRGEEALDMLQAMNTGHDGSLTTVHANTPRDALSRIETMIAMGNVNLPEKALRQQIVVGDPARGAAVASGRRHRARSRASRRSPAWKVTSSPCRKSSCSRRWG